MPYQRLLTRIAVDAALDVRSDRKPCPPNQLTVITDPFATVAELADAQDLGAGNGSLPAPRKPRQDKHLLYR
jgi:hypothetical protein